MVTWVTPPEEVQGDPADVIVEKYIQAFGNLDIELRPLVAVNRVKIKREKSGEKGPIQMDLQNSINNQVNNQWISTNTATNVEYGYINRMPNSSRVVVNQMGILAQAVEQAKYDFKKDKSEEVEYILKPEKGTINIPLGQLLADLKPDSETYKMILREEERLRNNMRAALGKVFASDEAEKAIQAFKFGDEIDG